MVHKSNGKWRMCVDYTDVNKAFPKDSYPLPTIDRLVDGADGHNILSFLDASSGYNQIQIPSNDKKKTAFRIDSNNFYYEVMPFGLKNAGATYQRLMDNVFHGMIGKSVEVYVDDIVVKSDLSEQHIQDYRKYFKLYTAIKYASISTNVHSELKEGSLYRLYAHSSRHRSQLREVQGDHRNVQSYQHKGNTEVDTALSWFMPKLAERM